MASPCGTSSGSSLLQNSVSFEEDLQALMDKTKQKRKLSNRESARRSRMRKQKHLDDLTAQVNQIRKENSQALTQLTLTTQQYFVVEAENSVLRTQLMELTSRLQSLNEFLLCLNGNSHIRSGLLCDASQNNENFTTPWNWYMNQPIMASSENMWHY
ncbi:bZIP transcription factor 44-like [Curcuma longa]|uniref:bZIP transcription factor 44-like n=1 Tax=Curcuma longa TaxID=136217 RepID=UPI003D9E19E6